MENNILSLRKSRGNSKYKLKSAIELTHKIPKIRRKNHFLASSSLSWAFFEKPRTSCVRAKGLPWKLIGKQILSTKPKLRNSEKNLHHCKFIYPFSVKAVSNTCIARSAAMVKEGHLYWMTRFYVSDLSTRHPWGIPKQDDSVLGAVWCPTFPAKSALETKIRSPISR